MEEMMRVSIFAHGKDGQFSIGLWNSRNELVAMATGDEFCEFGVCTHTTPSGWESKPFYESYVKIFGLKEHEVHHG